MKTSFFEKPFMKTKIKKDKVTLFPEAGLGYLLGPILVINPYFTKYLFEEMGYKKQLPYEKELIKAYEVRLKEYELLEEAKKHEK